ncbi:unnamed protein product [Jaminaea pallidilutea]
MNRYRALSAAKSFHNSRTFASTSDLCQSRNKMVKDAHDLNEGDKVSWKWGAGNPSGTVKDVVDGKAEVTTKRGNKIHKQGEEDNPAVKLNTGSSDAVKLASEINGVKPNK